MAIDRDDVISTLNGLIETCKDGQEGFKTAAEGIKDATIKSLFLEYSQQRAQFVGELQSEVRNLGGDPEKTGSVAAALHRGWMDIKSAVTGKDEHAILAECERGEDSAVSTYQDALKETLPGHLASVIQHQLDAIQEAHNRVRALRDAQAAADSAKA